MLSSAGMETLASLAAAEHRGAAHPSKTTAGNTAQQQTPQSPTPQAQRRFPAPSSAPASSFHGNVQSEGAARQAMPSLHAPQANFTAQGQQDPADSLLSSLIDVSKIKYVQNQTTAVLHADEYANR